MADGPRSVEALILAAGRGERLGLGPKALLVLGGRTLLERAIEVMQSVAGRILVGVPEDCVEQVRATVAESVVVLAGGPTRMETFRRLFRASTAPLLVQHDVVHPFATPDVARRVVAAEKAGAAMAVARVAEHVFRGEGRVAERVAGGEALWLARKPLAFRRSPRTRPRREPDGSRRRGDGGAIGGGGANPGNGGRGAVGHQDHDPGRLDAGPGPRGHRASPLRERGG